MECNHRSGTLSTLETIYVSPTEHTPALWSVRCKVCNKHTDACLTQMESEARANNEWWHISKRVARKDGYPVCPVCGGKARACAEHYTDNTHGWWFECSECGLQTKKFSEFGDAWCAWIGGDNASA